ncbi:MAG: glycosyltransferase [Bacteroidaceae bacterium]|nr:glycosyltransferase [Bacteroidaceae bacterium]
MPKVSVIVPNYNHSLYLRQRIDSILAQTFTDFELIILDDKSTDTSRDIIEEYRGNPHVSHIILNEKNTGSPFIQWEKGLSLAEGEYLWIAESDDFCTPDFLETCTRHLDASPDAALCHTGSVFVDGKGNTIDKTYDPWKEDGAVRVLDSTDYINRNMLFWDECYNASKVLFRRSAYERITKDFTTFRCAGDWLFMVSLMLHGDVIVVHRKLNRFRWHDAKVTSKSEKDDTWLYDKIRLYTLLMRTAPIYTFNKWMICGLVYKYIRRIKTYEKRKAELWDMAREGMGMKKWHYILERAVKLCSNVMPCLPEGKGYRRI